MKENCLMNTDVLKLFFLKKILMDEIRKNHYITNDPHGIYFNLKHL